MNQSFIPLLDAAINIEDSVTETATRNGPSLDMGTDFAPGGIGSYLAAVPIISAITSGNTYTFQLQESADDSTWVACGPPVPATAVGAMSVPGFVSLEFIRLALTVAGSSSPSITYTTFFGRLPNMK